MIKQQPFQRKFTLNDEISDHDSMPSPLSPTNDHKIHNFTKYATKSLSLSEQLYNEKTSPTMVQSAEIPKLQQWSVEPQSQTASKTSQEAKLNTDNNPFLQAKLKHYNQTLIKPYGKPDKLDNLQLIDVNNEENGDSRTTFRLIRKATLSPKSEIPTVRQ